MIVPGLRQDDDHARPAQAAGGREHRPHRRRDRGAVLDGSEQAVRTGLEHPGLPRTSWPAPTPSRAAAVWPPWSARWAPALVTMVTDLTLGKEKYAAVQDDMAEIQAGAEKLRARAGRPASPPTPRPTRQVAAAMKMPRDTDEQKKERSRVLQAALKGAADGAAQVAEAARRGGAPVPAGRREGQPQRGVRRRRGRAPGRRGRAVGGAQRQDQPGLDRGRGLQAETPGRGSKRCSPRPPACATSCWPSPTARSDRLATPG